jgi:hypothetical protein
MSDRIDPDELTSLDLGDEDPEDALRRLLAGAGTDQPVTAEAADALYEPTDTGVLGGVDEPNEALDAPESEPEPLP